MAEETEEVVIVERNCDNCEIRRKARMMAKEHGAEIAVRFRTPICVPCKYNPNMRMVADSPMLSWACKIMNVEPKDNWQPIIEENPCQRSEPSQPQ